MPVSVGVVVVTYVQSPPRHLLDEELQRTITFIFKLLLLFGHLGLTPGRTKEEMII